MITNEQQYRITKAWFTKFANGARQIEEQDGCLEPEMQQLLGEAYESEAETLRAQLEEYEALRSGRVDVLELDSLADLPNALIQARAAAGLTQQQLAARLGLKQQQIQRYEATQYAGVSLERVQSVAEALGVKIHERVILPRPSDTAEKSSA